MALVEEKECQSLEEALAEALEEVLILIHLPPPKKIICLICGGEFEYYLPDYYCGRSPKHCLDCREEYEEIRQKVTVGIGKRHIGHKTRQQHKKT